MTKPKVTVCLGSMDKHEKQRILNESLAKSNQDLMSRNWMMEDTIRNQKQTIRSLEAANQSLQLRLDAHAETTRAIWNHLNSLLLFVDAATRLSRSDKAEGER